MFPQVILIGRLTQNPEAAITSANLKYCRLSVACNAYSTKTRKNETNFFDLTVWSNRADFAEKYLKKGDLIVVNGYLTKNSYLNSKGNIVSATNIIVRELELLLQSQKNSAHNLHQNFEPPIRVSTTNNHDATTLDKINAEIDSNVDLLPKNDPQNIITRTPLKQPLIDHLDLDDEDDGQDFDQTQEMLKDIFSE